MNKEEQMGSLTKRARLTGLLWLLGSATAGFSLVYVRPQILVPGDAAATVSNMLAFESLFRAGIASMVLSQILLLMFGLAIFRIFQTVNRTLATVCVISLAVGCGVGIVNSLNSLGAITLVTNPDYAKAFQPDQINALTMTFLRMGNYGVGLVEIFMSIFLFSFGLLVLRSKYMPAFIGILLVVGSLGFPINTFTKILIPQFYSATFTQIAMVGGALGGALPMLWLLIMGAREPPRDEQQEGA
jgi:hypothetical protein